MNRWSVHEDAWGRRTEAGRRWFGVEIEGVRKSGVERAEQRYLQFELCSGEAGEPQVAWSARGCSRVFNGGTSRAARASSGRRVGRGEDAVAWAWCWHIRAGGCGQAHVCVCGGWSTPQGHLSIGEETWRALKFLTKVACGAPHLCGQLAQRKTRPASRSSTSSSKRRGPLTQSPTPTLCFGFKTSAHVLAALLVVRKGKG